MVQIVTCFQVWRCGFSASMMNLAYIFLVLSSTSTRAAEQDTLTQFTVELGSNRCVLWY